MLYRLHIDIYYVLFLLLLSIFLLYFFSISIARHRASDTKVNNSADIGQPCLIDLVILKSSVKNPFTLTQLLMSVYIHSIHFIKFLPNPNFSITFIKYLCSTLSNAFSKSTIIIYPFLFYLSYTISDLLYY